MAFSEQTYYRWKAKYGGMESARQLKQPEEENGKLKRHAHRRRWGTFWYSTNTTW